MSMEKNHTPGPWKAELITSGDKPAHPVYWNIKFSPTFDSNRAAINVYKGSKSTLQEAEANAHLIAAAPELLEACCKAKEWLCKFGEHAPIEFGGEAELYETLLKAIDKAFGFKEEKV